MSIFSRLMLTPSIIPSAPLRPNLSRHLPENLVISIFNFCDVKTLFNCCLVSKRFCYLVLQTESISLDIMYTIRIRDSARRIWPAKLSKFLSHFSHVQSATIVFFCYGPYCNNSEQIAGSILRWKRFPNGYIYFFAKKCLPSPEDDSSDICVVLDKDGFIHDDDADDFGNWLNNLNSDIEVWRKCIKKLVKALPNVKKITAMDSRKQGHFYVDEGGIDYMRGNRTGEVELRMKHWKAPLVKVPFSKCVMNDVMVCLVTLGEVSEHSVVENFCEEEYCQAALRIIGEIPFFKTAYKLPTFTCYC